MPGRVAAAIVTVAVALTSIGCSTKPVELPSGVHREPAAPTPTTAAPAQIAPTTTVTVPRLIHPAVSSRPVTAHLAVSPVSGGDVAVWDRLAQCESGGNWSDRNSPTYRGGIQFSYSTWRSVGGSGDPADASKDEQIARGRLLLARSGWSQWPACSRRLGLR